MIKKNSGLAAAGAVSVARFGEEGGNYSVRQSTIGWLYLYVAGSAEASQSIQYILKPCCSFHAS